jgi:hypothetical protein
MSDEPCAICGEITEPVSPDLGQPVALPVRFDGEKATTTFNQSDMVVITFAIDGSPDFDVNPI